MISSWTKINNVIANPAKQSQTPAIASLHYRSVRNDMVAFIYVRLLMRSNNVALKNATSLLAPDP